MKRLKKKLTRSKKPRFSFPKLPWKLGLFTILLGSDLLAKDYVDEKLNPGEEKSFLDGKLKIRKVYNKGFLLDTLDHRPDIVKTVSMVMAGFLAGYNSLLMNTKGHFLKKFGMVFLSAGATSNIFERVFKGKVVDYIGIHSGNEKIDKVTGNLADLYVLIGSVITSLGR